MSRPHTRLVARTVLSIVFGAGVCLLDFGCTAFPPPPTPQAGMSSITSTEAAAALPAGVSVRVYQTRFDYAERVLELSVENAGDSAFDLRAASFSSTRFVAPAAWSDPLVLEPGMTRDLRVHLPAAVCADRDAAADAAAGSVTDRVTVTWGTASGSSSTATVVPTDDTGALDRIEGEDCLDRAVEEVVTVSSVLRVTGVGPDSAARLDVTLTPTGAAGSVTVDRIGATVLLVPAVGADWPVGFTVDAGTAPAVFSLDLRPARCDPHAVAEDKRGTVFPLAVRAAGPGGVPTRTGSYDLAVTTAVRARLYDWIAARCGY